MVEYNYRIIYYGFTLFPLYSFFVTPGGTNSTFYKCSQNQNNDSEILQELHYECCKWTGVFFKKKNFLSHFILISPTRYSQKKGGNASLLFVAIKFLDI